jgi:hypothetical protein
LLVVEVDLFVHSLVRSHLLYVVLEDLVAVELQDGAMAQRLIQLMDLVMEVQIPVVVVALDMRV